MDEAMRRAFTQALHYNMTRSQSAHNQVQPGTEPSQPSQPSGQPENRSFLPNQHPSSTQNHMQAGAEASQPSGLDRTFHSNQNASSTRIFSPQASSTVQSHTSTPTQHTHQTNTIFYPNGVISSTSSPALQHVYQPTQQHLSSSTSPSSSVNSANQQMYQPSRLHPGPPYGQQNRHLFQPRYHPYGVSQSRPSQGVTLYYPQDTAMTSSPGAMSSSPSRPDAPTRPDTPTQNDISTQVQTIDRQKFLRYLQDLKQIQESRNTSEPQDRVNPQSQLPGGRVYNPAQLHVHNLSQNSSIGSSPSAPSQVQSPVQSYGRIQPPPRSTPQTPLPNKPTTPNVLQSTPRLVSQGSTPSHGITQPSVEDTPQTPQSNNSRPSRPTQTIQQPSPPRIWCPEMKTVTYVSLPIQAQPEEESNHPNQETLIGKTQERSLAHIHPHEFIDHLTRDHNACFEPKVARVFDMLYMQALLFHKDFVLLVSPTELQPPCWEPPQSIWHTRDLHRPEATSNTQVERHIYKALNLVSDILPDEVRRSTHHERHDCAVDLVKTNGGLSYGWSVTVSFDFKDPIFAHKFRRISPDRRVQWFTENEVKKHLDMIPVWKAKVLDIFELRRDAKNS